MIGFVPVRGGGFRDKRPARLLAAMTGCALLAPAPAMAKPKLPTCPPPHTQIFLSPMGEPFRAGPGAPYPVADWFAHADADHDGRITLDEMVADADRFFDRLDLDHDGELIPGEVTSYERNIAPEIALYQRDPDPGGKKKQKGGRGGYGGPLGAGRYSFLNIPEPVVAADADMNRAVDRAEFRAAARARFAQLDTAGTGALTLATLPRTPAQAEAIDCIPAAPALPPPPRGRSAGGRP